MRTRLLTRSIYLAFVALLVLLTSTSSTAGASNLTFTEFVVPTPHSFPQGITAGPDGAIWFTEQFGNKIGRITTTGTITEYPIPAPCTSCGAPSSIVTGPDGNLWFTEFGAVKIGRITPFGSITEFAIPTTNGSPWGITAGPDGNLWFAEPNANKIGRITVDGIITEFSCPCSTISIVTGPDGALWYADSSAAQIGRITTNGSITEYPIPSGNGYAIDITVGPDDALWFTLREPSRIGRITTMGSVTEYPLPEAIANQPSKITLGPDGALWFTEEYRNAIGRITTTGAITEYPLPTNCGRSIGCRPFDITTGLDGALWFTEFEGNQIGRAVPPNEGIDYHIRDDFHVFKIDMQSPNLSFEMVMANDVTSVNYGKPSSSPREYVRDMISRSPYVSRNPVLAFNADLFGNNDDGTGNHGPEGLTVKNGLRFDGRFAYPPEVDKDRNEWKRSSLSISAFKTVRIGKLTDCNAGKCYDWNPTSAYSNTVGGGPLFVDDGMRIGGMNSEKPCRDEKLESRFCNSSLRNGTFEWTAVGITQDGRYLIVVVSDVYKSMDQAAAVLIAEGAWKAIKLDGGGSTQVWYKFANPQSIIDGGRPVANALVVFSSP